MPVPAQPKDGNELREILVEYFTFYNHQRPHQQLDGLTPAHLHFGLPDTRQRGIKPTLQHQRSALTSA
ncbi:MAG: transposase [Flavobacteriales bacterium]|nr:transposase [Flavobacteriales bacterium]MBP7450719.1 integrase core domain-containing protein [Flavobacteriales bacterium]